MTRRSWLLVVWAMFLAFASALDVGGQFGHLAGSAGLATVEAAPDNSLILQPFITSGLSNPVFLTNAGDGSNRLFIVEQGGKIKIFSNGQLLSTPFLDLTASVVCCGEQGLLGLAFHPQFKTNGRFWVFYTAKPPSPNPTGTVGDNTLEEYQVSPANANQANPTPVRTLFHIPDPFPNHNAGMLGFGPDGYLYVTTGDSGSGGDPNGNGQNVNVLFGKMLRLDVDNIPAGATYGIPPTNPFVGQTDKRPEIWAYGFRNPWRWSFDRQTGDQLVGDVGQGIWEEIDVLPKGVGGGNYGWNTREGAHCFQPSTGCQTTSLIDPVLEYNHSQGDCAVIGGYVYRGSAFPSLQGTYLYADECTGRVWRARNQGGTWTSTEALDTNLNPSAFGEDEAGEVYLVNLGGSVLRVANVATCSTRPPVSVQVTSVGNGTLRVVVAATDNTTILNNTLVSLAFGNVSNALVTAGGRTDVRGGFTVQLPAGTRQTTFTVRRDQAGQALRSDLVVTDQCGTWPTFVGAGTAIP